MGGTNIIKSSVAVTNMICGNGNAIRDIDTSVENSKSSGYILGKIFYYSHSKSWESLTRSLSTTSKE